MKKIGIVFLFLWGMMNGVQAQDSTATLNKQFYFFLGGTAPLTSNQDHVFNVFGVTKSVGGLDYGAGFNGRMFTDKTVEEFSLSESQKPIHELTEVNISIGKTIGFYQAGFLSLFAGPTFVQYIMPHNFRTRAGGGKGGSSLEYDNRTYYLPGISARADVVNLPFRNMLLSKKATRKINMGASVGGLINYNRKLTSWGLNLNLVIGG